MREIAIERQQVVSLQLKLLQFPIPWANEKKSMLK